MASLESVWGGTLWAVALALAAGLWKGQGAEWVRAVPKLPPFKGCGLVGGGATAQLIPAGAQEAEMREMATKFRHRECLTQVITSFLFYALLKNSLPTQRS